MTLQRTSSGLANLHLFFKVERVVYCEGGQPLPFADIEAGLGDEETLDVFFWQCIFRNFGSGARTHFKSVGSKSALLSIADKVVSTNISRVIVCLDKDHDHLLGSALNDPRIVYTQGYSWENDVLANEPLASIFFRVRNRTLASEADYQTLIGAFDQFQSTAQRYCAYDVFFISKGREGMFRRDAPPSSILFSNVQPPVLNEAYLRSRLASFGYKRGPRYRLRVELDQVTSMIFGKLLSNFVYHLIRFFVPRTVGQFPSYNYFMRMVLSSFEGAIRNGGLMQLRNHYSATVP